MLKDKTKKARRKEIIELLKHLSNLELTLVNGHLVNKKIGPIDIYYQIKLDLKENSLEKKSDIELLSIIKSIDTNILLLKSEEKKEFLAKVAKECCTIITCRVMDTIKYALLITNQLLDYNQDQVFYSEVMSLKMRLQYYMDNIVSNLKLETLITKLDSIIEQNNEIGKQYEKISLPKESLHK